MKKSLIILSFLLSIGVLSGCNFDDFHEHTFKSEFTYDETNHWHEASCEHTDLISGLEAHNFGDDNICDDCGYVKPTEEQPHEHTFKTEYSFDDTHHWYEATCEHTDLTKGLETHNFGDDNICDACGYELIVVDKHIIYFESNGGSKVQPELVSDGEKITIPSEPTKENYLFLGWYESPEFAGNPYDFEQEVTKNVTLHALWGAKISFINFDGETYLEESTRLNTKIDEPENPSWGEARFLGWYESPDFEGTTFDFDSGVNKNVTLYARYGYALEYVGLNGQTISSLIQPADEFLSDPGETTFECYDFDNYYADSEYTQIFEFGKKLTKDTKIYLKLTPKEFNITYSEIDILTNLNPTSYVYGVGLDTLLEPTVIEHRKFCGWYFDEAFTQPATCIPADLHGDIRLYAKIGIPHTITYNGWPKTIENPNPTEVTNFDRITFDKSPLEAIEGISDVKLLIDGEEAPSNQFMTDCDLVVDVAFKTTYCNVTLDPNGGKILPVQPYFYIDGPLKGGKKKIEISNSGLFNLYDFNILNQIESIYGGDGLFMGYFKDNMNEEPLLESGTNFIENGSTIYAGFINNHPTGQYKNCPLQESGGWGDVGSSTNSKEINYTVMIPKGCDTIDVTFNVTAEGHSTLLLIDSSSKMTPLNSWSQNGDLFVIYSVNAEGMTMLNFQYRYEGSRSSFQSYSLSIACGTPDQCIAKISPAEQTVSGVFGYYMTPETLYIAIERENHTFMGWFDDSGNEIDLTEPWNIVGSNFRLTAKWKYLDVDSYINKLETYQENQLELASNCDALNDDNCIRYSSISSHLFEEAKTNILENDYSKDELDNIYETFCATIEVMFLDHAKYDLTQELLAKVNAYKDELEGYETEKGWLDKLYIDFVELIRDSSTFLIAIYNYDAAVLSINQEYQFIIEHIDI